MTSISVALCTYNGSQFLGDLLDSIISQNRLPDEIIILDDCSTDDTIDRLKAFDLSAILRVRFLQHTKNTGVNQSYQEAMKACTSNVIVIADQDDIWEPKRLEVIENTLSQKTQAVCFSDATVIDAGGTTMDNSLWTSITGERNSCSKTKSIIARNFLTGSCMALTHDCLPFIIGFPSNEAPLYDEWIGNISYAHPSINLILIDQPLLKYRRHQGQYSAKWSSHSQADEEPGHPEKERIAYRRQLFSLLNKHLKDSAIESSRYKLAEQFWSLRASLIPSANFSVIVNLTGHFILGNYYRFTLSLARSYLSDLRYYLKHSS